MAAALLTAQFTTAGGPYNVFKVLTGAQTTGVTLKTGVVLQTVSFPANADMLRIGPTTEVAGNMYFGNSTVNHTNKNGRPIAAGDTLTESANGTGSKVCLTDKWFDPDTNNLVICIEVE